MKLKQKAKDLSKQAALYCGSRHRQRRLYIQCELRTLVDLSKDVPGLLAPKFPMVLAALSFARAELLWVLMHKGQLPPKHRMKHLPEGHCDDPEMPVLFGLVTDLLIAVRANRREIQRYYAQFLHGAHRARLGPLLSSAATEAFSALGEHVQKILPTLLGHIETLDANAADMDSADLSAFRLDWARCTNAMAMDPQQMGVIAQATEGGGALVRAMHSATAHSAFIDTFDVVLEEHADLAACWWFQPHMLSLFDDALRGSVTTGHDGCVAEHAMAVLQTLAHSAARVSPHCPEEHALVLEQSQSAAEQLLKRLCDCVRDELQRANETVSQLDATASPIEAALRQERRQDARQEPLPGFENRAWAKEYIRSLREADTRLAHLLAAVNRTAPVRVFDVTYYPKEYVRSCMETFLASSLQALFVKGKGVARPSVIERAMANCVATLQQAASYMDINVRDILWRTLFVDDKLTQPLVQWYASLVETVSLPDAGVAFSPVNQAFVAIKRAAAADAEQFTNEREMRALCAIIGGHGVSELDQLLCDAIAKETVRIGGLLGKNQGALSALRADFIAPHWKKLVDETDVADLDALLCASVTIGNALQLRKLLHSARTEQHAALTPQMLAVAQSTIRCSPSKLGTAPAHEEWMAEWAADASVDQILRAKLAPLAAERAIWELLPTAFAAAMLGDTWKSGRWIPELAVFTNNLHVVADALCALFHCCVPTSAADGETRKPFEEYVQIASSLLLRMKLREASDFRDVPLQPMFLMVEAVVKLAPLDRSVLETYLPFSLLHTAAMDVSMSRQSAADTASNPIKFS